MQDQESNEAPVTMDIWAGYRIVLPARSRLAHGGLVHIVKSGLVVLVCDVTRRMVDMQKHTVAMVLTAGLSGCDEGGASSKTGRQQSSTTFQGRHCLTHAEMRPRQGRLQ